MNSIWNANKKLGVAAAQINRSFIIPAISVLIAVAGITFFIIGFVVKEKDYCTDDSDCKGDDNKCVDMKNSKPSACSKTKPMISFIVIGAVSVFLVAPIVFFGGRAWNKYLEDHPTVAAVALDADIAGRIS